MKKNLSLRLAALSGLVATSVGSAMAAVPADVTTELSGMGDGAKTIAGVVLLAVVVVFALKFLRKGL